jgi:TolB-like protein/Tfp pilus assembly protein PilF
MGEESPNSTVTAPTGAVFLSYASQDAEAAQRICGALRTAGIEVWFDQSELRGGDAWDHRIREQIHACRLFIPVISANSERRDEGYFRREWSLAVDRTRDMAHKRAFLIPVVIDDTPERGSSVPDKFHELQWTRLLGGDPNPAFVERIQRLLLSTTATQPVARAAEFPGALAPSAPVSAAPAWRRLALVVACVAVLAIGYWALNRLVLSKHAASAAAANTVSTTSPSSVAVLPLVNESGDPNQQYFADGLSEDLITALGQIPGLKVVGRVSSFRFRDSKEDSASIGAKLGVTHLVEGSVRRAGDVVRVSAELINAADGTMQWSERYDRPYKNLFALQDEVTRAVAGAMMAKLFITSGGAEQSDRPPSGSLEAYSTLLQGRFYLMNYDSQANCRKAIDQFSTSTRLDPDYALAWAELARAWMILSYGYLDGTPAQEAFAKARVAVDRALALSPNLAPAHVERASMFSGVEFDQQRALAEFRRAVQLAPDNAYARRALGLQLAYMGETEEGVRLMREALATDPLNVLYLNSLGYWLPVLGYLDEGERMSRKVMELNPDSVDAPSNLSYIEILRGNAGAALAAAESVPPVARIEALALARQIGPDRAAADAALKALIDESGANSAYQIAAAYALRNDPERTFEWLGRAWKNRDHGLVGLYADPFFKRFRSDPRFADLCRKVGLPVPKEAAARSS